MAGPAAQPRNVSPLEVFLWRVEGHKEIRAMGPPVELTFAEAVENLPWSADQLLTWLKAGMPYIAEGDWGTGQGFTLRPHWVIDFYCLFYWT
jgi:hypothetical protein